MGCSMELRIQADHSTFLDPCTIHHLFAKGGVQGAVCGLPGDRFKCAALKYSSRRQKLLISDLFYRYLFNADRHGNP